MRQLAAMDSWIGFVTMYRVTSTEASRHAQPHAFRNLPAFCIDGSGFGSSGWGMGMASSRAFKVGKSRQPCMLPLIDLCNHSFQPNCRMEVSADGTLRLIADGNIPADEAITITYGALSNTSLLQDYGFIVEDNPHDRVEMLVSADQIQVCIA